MRMLDIKIENEGSRETNLVVFSCEASHHHSKDRQEAPNHGQRTNVSRID